MKSLKGGQRGSFFGYIHKGAPPQHTMPCPIPLLSNMFYEFSQLSLRWNSLAVLEDGPEQGYQVIMIHIKIYFDLCTNTFGKTQH